MDTSAILRATEHRQSPLPGGNWIMRQSWQELLFAHWPVARGALRALLPASLEIDTFEQEGWVGIVPFRMRDVCPRGVPALPGLSASLELNVRTYVTAQGVPGVYFFSLDAANPLFVALARTIFALPYFKASMSLERKGECIAYRSRRVHAGAAPATYRARYRPTSSIFYAAPGSLPFWLTERYCLYTVDKQQRLYRADIHHGPWPLQDAELETVEDTMARSHHIALPETAPLLHYACRQDTLVWPLRRVETDCKEAVNSEI